MEILIGRAGAAHGQHLASDGPRRSTINAVHSVLKRGRGRQLPKTEETQKREQIFSQAHRIHTNGEYAAEGTDTGHGFESEVGSGKITPAVWGLTTEASHENSPFFQAMVNLGQA